MINMNKPADAIPVLATNSRALQEGPQRKQICATPQSSPATPPQSKLPKTCSLPIFTTSHHKNAGARDEFEKGASDVQFIHHRRTKRPIGAAEIGENAHHSSITLVLQVNHSAILDCIKRWAAECYAGTLS